MNISLRINHFSQLSFQEKLIIPTLTKTLDPVTIVNGIQTKLIPIELTKEK
jgi:hypothetical protein